MDRSPLTLKTSNNINSDSNAVQCLRAPSCTRLPSWSVPTGRDRSVCCYLRSPSLRHPHLPALQLCSGSRGLALLHGLPSSGTSVNGRSWPLCGPGSRPPRGSMATILGTAAASMVPSFAWVWIGPVAATPAAVHFGDAPRNPPLLQADAWMKRAAACEGLTSSSHFLTLLPQHWNRGSAD